MAPLKVKLSVKPETVEILETNVPEPKRPIASIYSTVGFVILLIYCILFIFGVMNSLGVLQNKFYPKISEKVWVDYENTIIRSLIAIHNSNKKILAFKDLTKANGRCYINVWDDTFEEGVRLWTAQETSVTAYFYYIQKPIDPEVLRGFAGQRIADHCAGITSHWVVIICKEEAERRDIVNRMQYLCKPNTFCPKCPQDDVSVRTTAKTRSHYINQM